MTSKHSPLIIAVLLLFGFFFTYFQLSVIYLFFLTFPFIFIYYELHLKKQHELEDKEERMQQSI